MSEITHIGQLTPDPANARAHTPRNIGLIETALGEVGAARSIVIDEDGLILAGNATVNAAAQAGIERVQVVDADGETIIAVRRRGLTPEQKVRLALFDNRAAELATWDASVLASLAEEIDLSGLFHEDELAVLLEEVEQEPADDAPVTIDESKPTRCQPGDVWAVGPHIVACLDSTDAGALDRVVKGKVRMVWADPPYAISAVDIETGQTGGLGRPGGGYPFGGAKNDGKSKPIKSKVYDPVIGDDSIDTAVRASGLYLAQYPDAVHFWWGANNYAHVLPPSTCWVVWDKENGTNAFADAELAWTNSDTAVRIFKHMWNGMLRESEQGERIHPTQKPIALCAWAFEKYGSAGDLILDPFLGSGPTIKAAHRMGNRRVIGFELSPHYIDHILEWAEAEGLTCARVDD